MSQNLKSTHKSETFLARAAKKLANPLRVEYSKKDRSLEKSVEDQSGRKSSAKYEDVSFATAVTSLQGLEKVDKTENLKQLARVFSGFDDKNDKVYRSVPIMRSNNLADLYTMQYLSFANPSAASVLAEKGYKMTDETTSESKMAEYLRESKLKSYFLTASNPTPSNMYKTNMIESAVPQMTAVVKEVLKLLKEINRDTNLYNELKRVEAQITIEMNKLMKVEGLIDKEKYKD